MPSPETSLAWDLTPVIDLLYSFPTDGEQSLVATKVSVTNADLAHKERPLPTSDGLDDDGYRKLGDFGTLWQFLAETPLASPSEFKVHADCLDELSTNSSQCLPAHEDVERDCDTFIETPTKLKGVPAGQISLQGEFFEPIWRSVG